MIRPRVAVVADLAEERWHSMDLVAEMLMLGFRSPGDRLVEPVQIRPEMVRRFTRIPGLGRLGPARTADRIVNRLWDYRCALASQVGDFDLFHIVDHSYAHLASVLPRGRSVVTCHDIDAFAGALPGTRAESRAGRLLAGRLLAGLQSATRIVCVSHATRDALVEADIVDPSRIVVVPWGLHPSCTPHRDGRSDAAAEAHLGPLDPDRPEILHVGSTIPRKRIDVLLDVFARLRARHPALRLVRVGGPFSRRQRRQVSRLGLDGAITVLPFLERPVLASVYRRAAVVLQPSEREGFGLPVAEAMACGTPVVASDLAPLREVGGGIAAYCPVGDLASWVEAVSALLDERVEDGPAWAARRAASLENAQRFDAVDHARRMLDVYAELLPGLPWLRMLHRAIAV